MPEMLIRTASSWRLPFAMAACLAAAACIPRPASLASGPAVTVPSLAIATLDAGPAGPTRVPSFVRPTPLPEPTFLAYSVKSGDTLTSIAHAFRTTPRSIAFWSRTEHPSLDPLSESYRPDRLEIGWTLLVIPGVTFDEDELPDLPSSSPRPPSASPTPSPVAS
jgi:LysM domain-containing protein